MNGYITEPETVNQTNQNQIKPNKGRRDRYDITIIALEQSSKNKCDTLVLVAEDDFELSGRRTVMHKRRTVMSKSESRRTRMLKEQRMARSFTCMRTIVMVPTTQLVCMESLTPTLTSHHVSTVSMELKMSRTRFQEVFTTANDRTYTMAFVRSHSHRNVEAVNERNAVRGEVMVTTVMKVELSERSWCGAAETVAFEAVSTVSGGAGEFSVVVVTTSTGPDATGPVSGWGEEGAVSEGWESEATFLEDGVTGVGLNGWPHGEGTVVDDGEEETASVKGGGEGDEEEEEGCGERQRGFSHCVFFFFW